MPQRNNLSIIKARENNLKDIVLELPHDTFIAITGLSGSGKSSLAFDTIYAEGQRRYIETFSPYTRQFFDKVKRARVDLIDNVRPAIAIQQRTRILNSRSTVGSMTDINDFLKIVWSNLAVPVCQTCGLELSRWDAASLASLLERWCATKPDATFVLGVRTKNSPELLGRLLTLGYSRYFSEKSARLESLEDSPPLKKIKEVIVAIDRCRQQGFTRKQAQDSLDQCFSLGAGTAHVVELRKKRLKPLARIAVQHGQAPVRLEWESYVFKTSYHCGDGEVSVERPRPALFSYNHPIGACPECNGFGKILVVDAQRVVPDHSKSIEKHAIDCWRGKGSSSEHRELLKFCKAQGISINEPWSTLSSEQRDLIFNHKSRAFVGVHAWFQWLERKKYKMHVRVFLARYRGQADCPLCRGTRLKADALAYRVQGLTISDVSALPLGGLYAWFLKLDASLKTDNKLPRELQDVFKGILGRLRYLLALGLPYLTLDRQSRTLSGGETQRVNLVSALGSNLISTHFVLDEPSVGLHARDTEELVKALRDLTTRGNSLTVVEHDPECLDAAEYILELGPAAGERGGEVTYFGTRNSWSGVRMAPFALACSRPTFLKTLSIRNAKNRNLKSISLDIPLESFVCLTGVSGSGKSSLLTEVIEASWQLHKGVVPGETTADAQVSGFEHVSNVLLVDQSPLSKTPRANIATYTKIWDRVRDLLAATDDAKMRRLSRSSFSFNVNAGRCSACDGAGFIREDMQFLSDVFIECESCLGMRFQAAVLEVRLKGKNVHEILSMSADSCAEFFEGDLLISSVCSVLKQLGLGHVTLGHPLSDLSGGEAQRLKLVPHIVAGARGRSLFLFDEPTTGLHVRDVERLIALFGFLRDGGHSIVCVEHNLRLIAAADWVVDLGPEGGMLGGEVIAQGTPDELVSSSSASLTARYLRDFAAQYGVGKEARSPAAKRRARTAPPLPTSIDIVGAREHNLKNISLSVPLNSLITITGVSGSGKSTIAKDILYAEGQRRYLDCLSPYARQFIKELKKPAIDDIRNVQPTICVYQHTFQPSALSTVATMSEVYNFLRLLYAKVGTQFCPEHPSEPISPLSAEQIAAAIKQSCSGAVKLFAPVINQKKGSHKTVFQRAIDTAVMEVRVDGRIAPPSRFVEEGLKKSVVHSIDFITASFNASRMPAALITDGVKQALAIGGGTVVLLSGSDELVFSSERTCRVCQRGFFKPDPEDLSFNSRRGRCPKCDGRGSIEGNLCAVCGGARINEIGRNIRLFGRNIHELSTLTAPKLHELMTQLSQDSLAKEVVEPIVRELGEKLKTLSILGLDHIALNRECATLSNGELQRLRLGTAMGSPLCGVTYIFDEPSAGLHPDDNRRLLERFVELSRRGNTVIQIEHEIDNILVAEHVIDVGPGAGTHGGEIVYQGPVKGAVKSARSATGRALSAPLDVRGLARPLSGETLKITNAVCNNLRGLSLSLPLKSLVTIAGVSGSGKSSLVHGVIAAALTCGASSKRIFKRPSGLVESSLDLERLIVVNQQPIGKTSRSTPASYLGVWDEIRKVFAATLEAKSRGWSASFFSHNAGKGRCPACKGQGEITLEMSFLAEARVGCESCLGSRFTPEAQTVLFKGISVSDALQLTFEQARTFFVNHRKIHQVCRLACDLGLGYLTLGQSSSTLSGGESQRLKLVSELHVSRRGHTLYILDEPTTGLHRLDVALLLKGLHGLVDQGHSVFVIEHDADTIAQSDWVLELGPGPGERGGRLIFEGMPSDLLKSKTSWGSALRERVSLHGQGAASALRLADVHAEARVFPDALTGATPEPAPAPAPSFPE